MTGPRTVLVLCPHNAAKSVIAAAYLERDAARRGLELSVSTAGTDPDEVASPAVIEALRAEGLDVVPQRPRRVTAADLSDAWRIVSLGCDPAVLAAHSAKVERWDHVPMVSQDLPAASAAIRERVADYLDRLAAELAAER
jgi:protein-tyrosine-phosphatase